MFKGSRVCIEDFKECFSDWMPKPIDSYNFYAVLVPLIEKDGEIHILYEVRAEGLPQEGQVCFPGGRVEADEKPSECAIRETCEEIGILPSEINLIGPLDYVHSYSNATIYPFLGTINPKEINPNPDEVKEIFLVPFSFFVETKPLIYQYDVMPKVKEDFPYETVEKDSNYRWRKGITNIPIYRYFDYPIWGLTAQITSRLVEIMTEHK